MWIIKCLGVENSVRFTGSEGNRVKFDRLSSNDRAHLVEAVQLLFTRQGVNAAETMLRRVSAQTVRFLRTMHAEEVVNEAVQLWINAARSRSSRSMRGVLAGALLPKFRKEAARQVEAALAGTKTRPRVIDVQAKVR